MTLILPSHEQHYPSLLLPHRLQEYVRDGLPPSLSFQDARLAAPQQVYDAIVKAQAARDTLGIDPRYFVGTCYQETNGAINEWDTEIATAESPTGFVSVGAYQIGQEEAHRYGYTLEDLLDLDKASDCMLQLAMDNLKWIMSCVANATKLGKASDLDYTDANGKLWPAGGVRAYMGICHNHGAGYVRATIYNYGLDWVRYKQRNPHDNIVAHGYGESCCTGGSWFNKVVEGPQASC